MYLVPLHHTKLTKLLRLVAYPHPAVRSSLQKYDYIHL